MSEWKTGEPPEDGWYWVFDASPKVFDTDHVSIYRYSVGWEVADMIWMATRELAGSWFPAEHFLWQGPLTPPDAPSKEDSHEA